jgi:hypothetical protein
MTMSGGGFALLGEPWINVCSMVASAQSYTHPKLTRAPAPGGD